MRYTPNRIISKPITSAPSPTEFTFKQRYQTFTNVLDPIRPNQEVASLQTRYDWNEGSSSGVATVISSSTVAGTTSSAWNNGAYTITLGANSGHLISTQVFLQATNNCLQYDVRPGSVGKLTVCLQHSTTGGNVTVGLDLGTGAFVSTAQTSTGSSTVTLTPIAIGDNSSSSAVVSFWVIVCQNMLRAFCRYEDGTINSATFLTTPTVTLNNVADNGKWRMCLYASTTTSTTIAVTRLRLGQPEGQFTGNHRMVTNQEGKPYIKDGRNYFLATVNFHDYGTADPQDYGNNGVGIYALDPVSGAFEPTALWCFERNSKYWAEGVSCVVFDEDTNSFRVATSTWGNCELNATTWDLHLYLYESDADLLHGTHVLRNGTQLPFDNANKLQYDASLVKANNLWRIVFTQKASATGNSNAVAFRSACYSSADLSTWTKTWEDTTSDNYEGATILRVNGTYYAFSTGNGGWRTHSLVTGSYIGLIPFPVGADAGIKPHPSFFMRMENGKTKYQLLTFNAASTLLYDMVQETTGYEFPIIR